MPGLRARVWGSAVRTGIGVCWLILPGLAWAELDETTLIGAGVRSRPAYDGSSAQVLDYVPVVRYFGNPWFIRTSQDILEGGVRCALRPDLQAGFQLAYEPGRETSESRFLTMHHAPDVDHGTSVGAFIEWDHKVGPVPLSLLARGRQHTRLGHGAQADLRLNAGVYGNGWVEAAVFAQASWASTKSNGTLYGIAREESAATGLPTFQAESGWSFASAGLMGTVNIDRRWILVGSAELHRLNGSVAQSPLAERSSGLYASLGLAYRP
jgi:outer membrane scaffolding protein for murein synthesis (MipA/OmpV family)